MNKAMDDQQIIALYWARNETAIRQTDIKYGPALHRISLNILSSREDSEECVNDTYLKAWNAMPPGRPDRLFAFLGRIIRNLSLNRFYENRARKRDCRLTVLLSELSDCIPAGQTVEEAFNETVLTGALVRWLEALSSDDRILFLSRYWFGDSVKELAAIRRTTPGKLAGKLFRLRNSLKLSLEKEEIFL